MLAVQRLCFEHFNESIFFFDLIFNLVYLLAFDLFLPIHNFESRLYGHESASELLYFGIFLIDEFGMLFFFGLKLLLHQG